MILFPEYQERGEHSNTRLGALEEPSEMETDLLNIEGLQVLVVDDQPDSARIIAKMLAQEGALVKWATSVPDALKIVESFHPNLIISDLAMPQEDGFELLRQFRASHPFAENGLIPLIAVSAYSEPSMMQKSFEEGFQAFLPKPLHKRYLLDAVGKLAILHKRIRVPESASLS